jgi:hypothetical protein
MPARHTLPLLLLLALTGAARADVAPPPGKKRLPVTRTIRCDKMPDGYAFYTAWYDSGITLGPRGRPIPPEDRKDQPAPKPRWLLGLIRFEPGVARSVQGPLYAVPTGAVPKNPGDEFAEALSKGKVPGALYYPYGSLGNEVPESDPRKEIIIKDVIERIDPEKGIIVSRKTNGPESDVGGGMGVFPVNRDPTPEARDWTRSPMTWVAASAAVAGLVLAGLWVGWRLRGRPVG